MSNALTSDRCYGVDVLKTLSMFMVVVLHLVPGIMGRAEGRFLSYWTATALQIGTYCCVNCFGLATGYLMTGRKAHYRKLIPMWLTVVVYSGIWLLIKRYVLKDSLDWITLLQTLFPVSASVYWYFSAYVCLYLFIPFLNRLVDGMSRQQHKQLLILGFLLGSIPRVANVTQLPGSDIIGLSAEHGIFWLMYLYLLGADMKKHGFFCGMSSGKALLGYGAMVALTMLSKYLLGSLLEKMPSELPEIVNALIWDYGSERFISSLSPTIVAEAFFLSVACINWKVPNWMRKPLVWLSPLLFQVYIIHTNPVPFAHLGRPFEFLGEQSTGVLVVGVLGCAAGIFLVCIAIDWVRFQLFRLLQVNRWTDDFAQWTGEKVRLLLNKKTAV